MFGLGSSPSGSTKFMADDRWKELFKVIPNSLDDGDIFSEMEFRLVNRNTGEVVGKYRDRKYARKQARHKYNKLVKLIESCLTS